MTNTTFLYLPMQVEAWVLTPALLKTQDYALKRGSLDFTQLAKFKSPNLDVRQRSDYTDKDMGVYVHWIIPPGLRKGEQSEDQAIEFPAMPNRWLVVRYNGSTALRQSKAWVVESDYLDVTQQNGSATYPNANDISQPLYLGQVVPLENWQEDIAHRPEHYLTTQKNFTATDTGEVTFTLFQSYGQNIVSLQDASVKDFNEQETLSYFVAGWYAAANNEPKQDPLYDCQTADDFIKRLARYHCTLTDEKLAISNPIANRILCHGMVNAVVWDPQHLPESAQNSVDPRNIKIAVGNSTREALEALVGQDPAIGTLLQAFQANALDTLDQLDGAEQLENQRHEAEFGSVWGSIHWRVAQQQDEKISTAQDPAAPDILQYDDICLVLNNLNEKQLELDKKECELKALRWELYALWWKTGRVQNNLDSFASLFSQKFLAQANPRMEELKDAIHRLIKKASDGGDSGEIEGLTKLRDQLKDNLNKLLNNHSELIGYTAKSYPANRFWQPNDPVVLITNIKSPWNSQAIEVTPSRLPVQLLTSLQYDNWPAITVAAIADVIPNFANFAQLPTELQGAIKPLLDEWYLLDVANAQTISEQVTGIPRDDLTNLLKGTLTQAKLKFAEWQRLPIYSLAVWSQPWWPIFLEWDINWYPIELVNSQQQNYWQFNGKDYNLTAMPSNWINYTMRSRTLLTPHSNFTFKAKLKQLLIQHPQLALDEQSQQTELQTIDNWDILAQQMQGFNAQLTQRLINQQNRVPHFNDPQEREIALLLAQDYQGSPMVDNALGMKFQPLRQGQFFINSLAIVDRFGQVINLSVNDKNLPKPIIYQALKPNIKWSPPILDKERLIQLPPRVIQAARLNFNWLDAKDNTKQLPLYAQTNPILGWLLPNYLDQSLDCYSNEGNNLGKLRVTEDENNQPKWSWEPALLNPFASHQAQGFIMAYPYLSNLIGTLLNLPSQEALKTQREILQLNKELSGKLAYSDSAYQNYWSAVMGRPLALARASLQLELALPPYQDQSWPKTFTPDTVSPLSSYNFSMQMGNPNLLNDGLLGVFMDQKTSPDFSQCYYSSNREIISSYLKPMTDFQLNDDFKLKFDNITRQTMTLWLDPQASVYVYTGILPVKQLQLPAYYVKQSLEKLSVTFRLGPLLTLRNRLPLTQPDKSLVQESVILPKPSSNRQQALAEKETDWYWLEYRDPAVLEPDEPFIKAASEDLYAIASIKPHDTQCHLSDSRAMELVEGDLCLQWSTTKQLNSKSTGKVPNRHDFFKQVKLATNNNVARLNQDEQDKPSLPVVFK